MEATTPAPTTHFASVDELASFMDTNCRNWNSIHGRDLKTDLRHATAPEDVTPFVAHEIVAIGVWFDGCTIQREHVITIDGETSGSPLPNELEEGALKYYQQRFEQTSNPLLKARYGLILWNAPKPYKNGRSTQTALDGLLTALAQADCTDHKKSRDCIDIMRQACAITTNFRYREDDTATAVLDRFSGVISFERAGRNHIFKLITEQAKLFRSNARADTILPKAKELFEENFATDDFFACQHLCELAAPFAQGSGQDPREWHHLRGRSYEALAISRLSDDSSLVPIQFYTQAAMSYQLAGDETAEQQALQQAQELKSKIRLGSVSTQLPDDHAKLLFENIQRRTNALLSHESEVVIGYLATNKEVIPDYQEIKGRVQAAGFSLSDIVSVQGIDVNKNMQRSADQLPDGLPAEKFRMFYGISLSFRLQYLAPIFIEGYKTGKFTFETLTAWLDKNSWVAQPLEETDVTGEKIEYTWKPILYPALEEFFKQLALGINRGGKEPSFVLCLDSLSLKIEGMLRELLQHTGATTLATNKKHDLREVFFDELLDTAQANGLLSESEGIFFRYLFTPLSQNVRNNIAHSYYHLPQYYSLESIMMVICAMLRLASTHLTEVPAGEQGNSNDETSGSTEPHL